MYTLLTTEQLSEGIDRLARDVRQAYGDGPLTVVGVLTGSVVVVSDLIRRLDGPVRLSMVWASSYRGTATQAGRLELRLDLLPDLTGQHVLLVDDIFDSGRTLDGLDYDGAWRHLPHVAALDPDDLAAGGSDPAITPSRFSTPPAPDWPSPPTAGPPPSRPRPAWPR